MPELKIMNTFLTCILQNIKVYNNSDALVNIKSDEIKKKISPTVKLSSLIQVSQKTQKT